MPYPLQADHILQTQSEQIMYKKAQLTQRERATVVHV